jgi:hypothetical protein
MQELDDDNGFLKGQTRDCVQFLALKDVQNDERKLTRELLKEVPTQLTTYFDSVDIHPNDPSSLDELREKFNMKKDDSHMDRLNDLVQN